MHPVERKYENPLRKHAREKFNHYIIENKSECRNDNCSYDALLTTSSLLIRIKKVEGWLSDQEADLLIALTLKACKGSPSPIV
jgi:hypothetical protein